MENRLRRMRAAMADSGIESFFCTDLSNVKWLTGFEGVFDDEPAHTLFVSADEAAMHTDSRYDQAACNAAAGTPWQVDASGGSHAAWVAARVACRSLAIEDSMTLAAYRSLTTALDAARASGPSVEAPRETGDFVRRLRAVKDAAEIDAMRAAQTITDAAFEHIAGFMRIGMTEREVQLELEETMRRMGADELAFSSIVASGANGAAPHSIPGEKRLEEGDMVVLDFGARKNGYCSDMTRTVCMGRATDEARRVFAAVRAANEAVEAMLRPGVTGAQAHELAEQVLAREGFAGKMGHGLGHGVGIDIHELPNLSPRNLTPLEAGNVVTVEPGVYLGGVLGCRLEDFGVITEDGFEVFTKSTHELVII
ncbi:Xaa-Pro peptidase family protein [uncultured Slackia sp.]|uniref:M24 family metallopeptidase n=1 Tax=uncultured Slackia sp. TaxID=665903 RepID=UPI0026DFE3FB|nr:Xaa-Pro peptidase family protein [uncultured Slackia sp.]